MSFNPRARVGRDFSAHSWSAGFWSFNPRARVGRDTPNVGQVPEKVGMFQSTRPRGARLTASPLPRRYPRFNPRARVGRDAMAAALLGEIVPFQSTRPRGARPGAPQGRGFPTTVSIHAPAWGATRSGCYASASSQVSIHAPAWGATSSSGANGDSCSFQSTRPRGARPWLPARFAGLRPFQSTRPRGARRGMGRIACTAQAVSIHAPAWGATWRCIGVAGL